MKCVICGADISHNRTKYTVRIIDEMELDKYCFDCGFWMEKVNGVGFIDVNGTSYKPCGLRKDVPGSVLGYGGALFTIELLEDVVGLGKAGDIIQSNNVWCQGSIPKRFQGRIPKAQWAMEPMWSTSPKEF